LVAGQRHAVCLAVLAVPEQMGPIIAALDTLFTRLGRHPAVLQTDRGSCFIGTDGGASATLPGRLTLWLWGQGIVHRLTPAGKPQRNGAVERLNGAVERSWQDEPDGLAALLAVWNWGKTGLGEDVPRYGGRATWGLSRMWERLAHVQVRRKVDRQGKVSVWNRLVSVGHRWRDRPVVVSFDATRQLVCFHDERGALLTERSLPWLTADWVWTGQEPAPTHAGVPPASELGSSTTFG
jgi:hypothetical protein